MLSRALAKRARATPAESCRRLIDEAREALGILSERRGWRGLPRRTKLALALIVLAVAAAAAVPALLLTGGTPATPPLEITATSLVRFDPDTDEPTAVVDFQSPIVGTVRLAAGNGAVWLADRGRGTVLRIDEATGTVTSTTALPNPAGIAVSPTPSGWLVPTKATASSPSSIPTDFSDH